MAGANWPRYIAANVCYPAGKLASLTAGVGREAPEWPPIPDIQLENPRALVKVAC